MPARPARRAAGTSWRWLSRAVPLGLWLTAAAAAIAPPALATTIAHWSDEALKQPAAWYASAEARALADSVVQYQSPQGGWPKNTDLARVPASPADVPGPDSPVANTFDNDGTTVPMQFLAQVISAGGPARLRAHFDRGLAYTLQAQYPNGGWPQFYPLRKAGSYYNHITFNDGAMVQVLVMLQGVAEGSPPYGFTSPAQRAAAQAAVQRGLAVVLASQVRHEGRLTAWCAQIDEVTQQPAWARKYEPPSLSGGESVGIALWLMSLRQPSAEVVAAVDGAVAWFRAVAIHGQRYDRFVDDQGRRDRRVVDDPAAGPMWARFYELGTMRPLFLGRDSVFRYSLAEIEQERRAGYAYYNQLATELLASYPAWKALHP